MLPNTGLIDLEMPPVGEKTKHCSKGNNVEAVDSPSQIKGKLPLSHRKALSNWTFRCQQCTVNQTEPLLLSYASHMLTPPPSLGLSKWWESQSPWE
jgi:hypothetical protein